LKDSDSLHSLILQLSNFLSSLFSSSDEKNALLCDDALLHINAHLHHQELLYKNLEHLLSEFSLKYTNLLEKVPAEYISLNNLASR
jgi:hypothetical protein